MLFVQFVIAALTFMRSRSLFLLLSLLFVLFELSSILLMAVYRILTLMISIFFILVLMMTSLGLFPVLLNLFSSLWVET